MTGHGILRRTLKIGLVLAGMAIAAAAGTYVALMLSVRGKDVVVPNLVEMKKDEAEAAVASRRLILEIVGTRADPRIGAGGVLEQDPAAGARTRTQRTIRVVVSLGQEMLEVPAFVGEPVRKAQLTLRRMGLRVGSVAHASSIETPADQVLAQRPAPGARRLKGEPVDLLVSRGPGERVYVMPTLHGLTIDRASQILKDGGVRAVLSRRQPDVGVGADVVLEQQPPEGFPIREKQTVHLVVSQ